jgi:hypothetical protein
MDVFKIHHGYFVIEELVLKFSGIQNYFRKVSSILNYQTCILSYCVVRWIPTTGSDLYLVERLLVPHNPKPVSALHKLKQEAQALPMLKARMIRLPPQIRQELECLII